MRVIHSGECVVSGDHRDEDQGVEIEIPVSQIFQLQVFLSQNTAENIRDIVVNLAILSRISQASQSAACFVSGLARPPCWSPSPSPGPARPATDRGRGLGLQPSLQTWRSSSPVSGGRGGRSGPSTTRAAGRGG